MEALYIQFLQGVLLKYQHIPLLDVVGRRLSFKFQMYPWLHVTLQKNETLSMRVPQIPWVLGQKKLQHCTLMKDWLPSFTSLLGGKYCLVCDCWAIKQSSVCVLVPNANWQKKLDNLCGDSVITPNENKAHRGGPWCCSCFKAKMRTKLK